MIINEKVRLGELEVNLDRLAEFIVEGKKKGFAGGGEYIGQKDGSGVFTFKKGNLQYQDKYWGSTQAPGYELVSWIPTEQGLWFMSYSGGMLPKFREDKGLKKETFTFLKKALSKVTPERPFRGPAGSEDSRFSYSDIAILPRDLKRFAGREEIRDYQGDKKDPRFSDLVFSQDYIGGLIIS